MTLPRLITLIGKLLVERTARESAFHFEQYGTGTSQQQQHKNVLLNQNGGVYCAEEDYKSNLKVI